MLGLPGTVWWLAITIAMIRVIFLLLLSPYDLVGDEAHYWEWSKRLDWSYYSKGPGVAWTIAFSTWLLGDTEFGVRMPAVIFSLLTTLVLARLTLEITGGDRQAAFLAAALFNLMPINQAMGLLMTIDGPMIFFWALALWLTWRLMRAADHGRAAIITWMLLGVAIGVGFLFKYTTLLLPVGLLIAVGIRAWGRGAKLKSAADSGQGPTGGDGRCPQRLGLVAGVMVFLIVASPVAIWNHQHQWPTVRHLAGGIGISLPGALGQPDDLDPPLEESIEAPADGEFANADGNESATATDEARPSARRPWTPLHFVEFTGAQFGVVGPALLPLMILAIWRYRRGRGLGTASERFMSSLIWSGIPVVGIYVAISVFAKAQGNWAAGGYVGWVPLAAIMLSGGLQRHRTLVRNWLKLPRPRPRRGFFRKRPETMEQVAWHITLGFGLVCGLGMLALPWVKLLPVFGPLVPIHRITGFAQKAQAVDHVAREVAREHDQPVIIAAANYQRAGLLRFYLPGQPRTFSAQNLLGGRRSSYDYFADTNLADDSLRGVSIVAVGGSEEAWRRALKFDSIEPAPGLPMTWIILNFEGVRPQALADRDRW
ncbi:MAG: glycosyltransferase family 39 protein [Phycisphaeraceae bacterium]|nr:glycosyltransferase family 39 protein [Phycisphaeraceae bacterium]